MTRRSPKNQHRARRARRSFFELALEDLTRAADLFRPIYDETNGVDGWVSLEVSPLLAYDTASTIAAARDLFHAGGASQPLNQDSRDEGRTPAIEEAIFSGIPVNVTLLFSREQYVAAAEAFLRASSGASRPGSIPMSPPSHRYSSAVGTPPLRAKCLTSCATSLASPSLNAPTRRRALF